MKYKEMIEWIKEEFKATGFDVICTPMNSKTFIHIQNVDRKRIRFTLYKEEEPYGKLTTFYKGLKIETRFSTEEEYDAVIDLAYAML